VGGHKLQFLANSNKLPGVNLRGSTLAFDPDAALRVLASPALRQALELVAAAEISSGELADTCGWTRPATSQHLRALRQASLVEVRIQGNRRLYRARPESLAELRAFLDDFWAQRLGALVRQTETAPAAEGVGTRREDR
jgi:DNA-binding transcriptional ArsR family regulator